MKKASVPKRAADRIRETAEELFYREGIRAVGVDEIVARAGVTKPSLYRSYPSKDELAADYLRHHGQERLRVFDDTVAAGRDPRDGFHNWLEALVERSSRSDYRGCGNSNAAVEYPERDHPARKVAGENKRQFRLRLHTLAKAMGARRPDALADALLLVIEGTFSSGQLFGAAGPARHLIETVDLLIDAHVPSAKRRSHGD